jgi:hypothetical protein
MRVLILLWGGWLAGCHAPLPPPAGARFDGEYFGQDTLIRGGGYPCEPAIATLGVAVRDGRFDYPFPVNLGRTAPVPVQVAADGTFAGQMLYGTDDYTPRSLPRNAWVTVRGRIADGTLEAVITDYRCTHRLIARRG